MRNFCLYFVFVGLLSLSCSHLLFFLIYDIWLAYSLWNLFDDSCVKKRLVDLRENAWSLIFSKTIIFPIIFTIFAFTDFSTRNVGIVAFAVFFQTKWFFAITGSFFRFYRLFIRIFRSLNFLFVARIWLSLAIKIFCIFASYAFASLTTFVSWIE